MKVFDRAALDETTHELEEIHTLVQSLDPERAREVEARLVKLSYTLESMASYGESLPPEEVHTLVSGAEKLGESLLKLAHSSKNLDDRGWLFREVGRLTETYEKLRYFVPA